MEVKSYNQLIVDFIKHNENISDSWDNLAKIDTYFGCDNYPFKCSFDEALCELLGLRDEDREIPKNTVEERNLTTIEEIKREIKECVWTLKEIQELCDITFNNFAKEIGIELSSGKPCTVENYIEAYLDWESAM